MPEHESVSHVAESYVVSEERYGLLERRIEWFPEGQGHETMCIQGSPIEQLLIRAS